MEWMDFNCPSLEKRLGQMNLILTAIPSVDPAFLEISLG
jgi:hypothetical protein